LIDYLFTSEFATIINKEGRKERGRAEGRKEGHVSWFKKSCECRHS